VEYTIRIHVTTSQLPQLFHVAFLDYHSCNLTSATSIIKDLLLPMSIPWCMGNYVSTSAPLGEIPCECCSFVVKMRTESHVDIIPSAGKKEKGLEGCPSLPKLFAIIHWFMIPPPTGSFWLSGTSVYNILPSQFNSLCSTEKIHTPPQALHIKKNLLLPQTKKMAAFQDSIVHKHSGQELLEH